MEKGSKHTEEAKQKISKSLSVSMIGNSNAEKWTEEVVLNTLKAMLLYAEESKISLKLSILIHFKIYNRNWFSEMKEKFASVKAVFCIITAIEMICENNTYNAAYAGVANASMAKLALASHYGWTTERTENKTEQKTTVDLSNISTDKLLEMRERIRKENRSQQHKSGARKET